MKLKIKIWLIVAISLSIGIIGCNLFNPTQSENIDSNDAPALTYQGYLLYQKTEYTEARKYFNLALDADLSYSEAWYGLAKTVLNMQPSLNIFELISYARNSENGNALSGFQSMSDIEANLISNGIDSVMKVLDGFINLDTLGLTDKKIRFSSFSNSYTILRLTKIALSLRKSTSNLNSIFSMDSANGVHFDFSSLGSTIQGYSYSMQELAYAAEALKANPQAGATIIKAYFMKDSSSSWLTDKAYEDLTIGAADFIISTNKRLQEVSVERLDVFQNYGDLIDSDGDGCVDEEIPDGFDNDGDGEIDEDPRPEGVKIYELDFRKFNLTSLPVKELKILDQYQVTDIDMNGIMGSNDLDEWNYHIKEPAKRNEANGGYLLNFVIKESFYSDYFMGLTNEERILLKEDIRHDTDPSNLKYNLEDRKALIGGCWNNYDQVKFLQWFNGRNY